MKPETYESKRQLSLTQRVRAGVFGCLTVIAAFGAAQESQAQSAYACRDLETHAALPAVEGKDGVFFRIRPDLFAHQAMTDQTIQQIARFSQALRSRGTTLVVLPVPGRAQVLAHQLPDLARHLGYDADIASSVHHDMIHRFEEYGVLVADSRSALRRAALEGRTPFFAFDPRPTAEGAKVMAQSVADVLDAQRDLKGLQRVQFNTTTGVGLILPSGMRAQLQLACQNPLPQVNTPTFATNAVATVGTSNSGPRGSVAVIGTEFTGTGALNFAGFLSEYSGLAALAYGVDGGGPFAAISSYLTSVDFQAAPPRVLVWEFPVWEPMGNQGDQPMKELIAAASATCNTPLPIRSGSAGNVLVADLSGLGTSQEITLALDTGGVPTPEVRFHFTSADGLTRTRGIFRHPGQLLTGRFFLPLSGMTETQLRAVEIELPVAFGGQPSLLACIQGANQ